VSYELSIRRLYEKKRKGRNEEEVKKDKIEFFLKYVECRRNLFGIRKITQEFGSKYELVHFWRPKKFMIFLTQT